MLNKFTTGFYIFTIIALLSLIESCTEKKIDDKNILSLEDKQIIGYTIDTAITSFFNKNTEVLAENTTSYKQAYIYINKIKNKLASNTYLTQTPTIRIIHDTINTQTAFVGPNGYIYIYTGFLKTLSSEAQFAGVLSCLMACSESGNPLEKLENNFSKSYLIDLALGGNIANIESIIQELKDVPYDSLWVANYDKISLKVLCTEEYHTQEYSIFFSLYPSIDWLGLFPRDINTTVALFNNQNSTNCTGTVDNPTAYQNMINTLP